MKHLITISNKKQDSLFFFRLKTLIKGYLKDATCMDLMHISAGDSTLSVGYILEQAALVEERGGIPRETVCFASYDGYSSGSAAGVIFKLNSGLTVLAPNDGKTLSFVKPQIEKAYAYDPLREVSLRSGLEEYARVLAHLMDYEEEELDLQDQPLDAIDGIHGYFACYKASPSILHTNLPQSVLKGAAEIGQKISLKIDGSAHEFLYTDTVKKAKMPLLVNGEYGRQDDPYLKMLFSLFEVGQQIEM